MDFSSLNPGSSNGSAGPITLNLSKGSSFTLDLNKPTGAALSAVRVSLIWDPVVSGTDVDLDLSAFLLHNGHVLSAADVIYFNTPKGAATERFITHSDDSRTGAEAMGDDEDEWIQVDLTKVPADVTSIVFVANIFNFMQNSQTFGVVRSLARIADAQSGRQLANFALSSDYSTDASIVLGAVERSGTSWVFNTIGDGSMLDLNGLLARFM